jgi:hypothetical protein
MSYISCIYKNRKGLWGGKMNLLKNLKINGSKNLEGIGLKNLIIDRLKNMIHKLRYSKDTDIKNLTKNRDEIQKKIKDLVREKKEIESRIVQLQNTEEEKAEKRSESRLQEKKREERTDNLDELKKTGEEEKRENIGAIDNIGTKDEVIEAKPDSRNNAVENSGIVDIDNSASKVEKVVFFIEEENTKDEEKIKIANSILQENRENSTPEKSKTENEKFKPDTFRNSLIEELMESEDLYQEEEQSFMKYIEESSVTEIVANLKEVKKLLAQT